MKQHFYHAISVIIHLYKLIIIVWVVFTVRGTYEIVLVLLVDNVIELGVY